MQTPGGYDERPLVWRIFMIASFACLLLNLEGTLMWAFSLSPHGGLPPQGKIKERVSWFFELVKGQTVTVNPKMFYAGIFALLLSAVIQALLS